MARARLHLICGNCGCNDEWEWSHIPKLEDDGEVIDEENVHLSCRNCGTLHSLNDNAKTKKVTSGIGTIVMKPFGQGKVLPHTPYLK